VQNLGLGRVLRAFASLDVMEGSAIGLCDVPEMIHNWLGKFGASKLDAAVAGIDGSAEELRASRSQ